LHLKADYSVIYICRLKRSKCNPNKHEFVSLSKFFDNMTFGNEKGTYICIKCLGKSKSNYNKKIQSCKVNGNGIIRKNGILFNSDVSVYSRSMHFDTGFNNKK
jgi:hypothetical protein